MPYPSLNPDKDSGWYKFMAKLTLWLNYYDIIKAMELGRKEKFLQIYANLPLGVRQEIILVLDDRGPITWDVAYIEVDAGTPLSKTILEKLEKLNII
jgi:hypothetical protein